MLGEKVGWVSKFHFFILKNKVKIWTVWPFHSYIPRVLVGRLLEAGGPGPRACPCWRIQASPLRCHGIIYYFS